jgi:hypothetical protein
MDGGPVTGIDQIRIASAFRDSKFWTGHGTMMAGVALYCDLEAALATGDVIELTHRLETVKVLPPHAQNDRELYGVVTEVGIGEGRRAG